MPDRQADRPLCPTNLVSHLQRTRDYPTATPLGETVSVLNRLSNVNAFHRDSLQRMVLRLLPGSCVIYGLKKAFCIHRLTINAVWAFWARFQLTMTYPQLTREQAGHPIAIIDSIRTTRVDLFIVMALCSPYKLYSLFDA